MGYQTRGSSKLDKVAAEHRRRETTVEVARTANFHFLVLEGVIPHLSAVSTTSVAGVDDVGRRKACSIGFDWGRGPVCEVASFSSGDGPR